MNTHKHTHIHTNTHTHTHTHTHSSVDGCGDSNWCTVWVGCLLACLTSQQHASVFLGQICSGNCTCNHTEIEVADQTFQLTQSEYTDTGPTSHSTHPITPGTWQGSQWSAKSLIVLDLEKSWRKQDLNPGSSALEADAITSRPARRSQSWEKQSFHTQPPSPSM